MGGDEENGGRGINGMREGGREKGAREGGGGGRVSEGGREEGMIEGEEKREW